MKRTRFNPWPTVAPLVLGSLLAASAVAQPRCEKPNLPGERTACEKAKEGPEALQHFIQRTRAIYLLYFWDYITEEQLDQRAAQRQAQADKTDMQVAAAAR